jgi:carbamoyl-phosphate synthase large subunit
MKEVNVLISGAGGSTAVGAIKSLRMAKLDVKITAVDSNPLSAGFHLADNYYVVSPALDKMFMGEIRKIIEKEKIDLIMPTSGFDILPLSLHRDILSEMGVVCYFSDYPVVKVCDSKYKFYTKIEGKFPLAAFSLHHNVGQDYPVIVKPIYGKGSRDTYICRSEATVIHIMGRHENMLVCEYLPGKEYTIDVLSDLHGRPLCAVPRERIETKAGISSKGKVLKDKKMENLCKSLAKYLGLKGPSCMQMKEDKDGVLKFIEVNPRMGGGTIMTALSGVNIPHLILKLYNEETISEEDLTYEDKTILRYYEEIVL